MTTKHLSNITLSLVALTLLSGGFLISSTTSAEDESVVDEVNISVPVSCSLSGTGMSSHTANIVNGTYQADIGITTLKAFCNDNNGFAIYANGYTGDTLGNNKLIGSSTSSEIVTGTATTAGSPDVSNWAMKLETNSSATYALTLDNGFSSYSSVPSSYTKVAHRGSGTDLGTSAEGATLTSTYAAYISKTQPADSYLGQVIYTLVHPASEEPLQPQPAKPGKIVYHPNNSSVVGTMGDQDATNSAETTLWASNFKRTGYGFAGWNTAYDYSGTNYGPNQTITAPADVETNGLSLYAVWIKSQGTIQNWDGCDSLAQGSTTALTDERDGNTYAVAKLADGKCWMIENLKLDNTPELTSVNTHNPSLPLTNIYDSNTTSSHLSPTSSIAYDATVAPEGWCTTSTANCVNQSRVRTDNTILYTNNNSSSYSAEGNVYSNGNYYNWYSATAGHGTTDFKASNTSVSGDVCPAGWTLPKGGLTSVKPTSDLYILTKTLMGGIEPNKSAGFYNGTVDGVDLGMKASNSLRAYPNNYIYSGAIIDSNLTNRNSQGAYWSSTTYSGGTTYFLNIRDDLVSPGTYNNYKKSNGLMIRCVYGR